MKSVTTTAMARLLAEHHGVDCIETPVGFKHIGPVMMREDALIGGEESGGYGFRGHLPERDGILSALYLLDAMAMSGKGPAELLEDVFAITGPHFYERVDTELEPGANDAVRGVLDAASPHASSRGCRSRGSTRRTGGASCCRRGGCCSGFPARSRCCASTRSCGTNRRWGR